jgi:hypothetical protein
MIPATTIAELDLLELGAGRLAFAPVDGRPLNGAGVVPPADGLRYAYVEDYTVVLYREEQDVSGQLNIEIEQGTTWTTTIWWKQVNQEPVDMSGFIAKMQIRAEKSTTSAHKASLASYAAEVGDPVPWFNAITITEAEGKIYCYLTPAETAQIPEGLWYYDLVVENAGSGETFRLVEGSALIDPGVTA